MPADLSTEALAALVAAYDSDDPSTWQAAADEFCDDAVAVPLAREVLRLRAQLAEVEAEAARNNGDPIARRRLERIEPIDDIPEVPDAT